MHHNIYSFNPLCGASLTGQVPAMYGMVCDGDFGDSASTRYLETEVQVRSGDYIATLITALDSISQSLPEACGVYQDQLERAICSLQYVDQHYRLTKKQK